MHGRAGQPNHPGPVRPGEQPQGHAARPREEVRAIIRPCGLSPQKSKAIVRLSEILMDEHGGIVPQDMDCLLYTSDAADE